MRPYVAELMHERAAAYYGKTVHHYFACELGGIADDYVVAHGAVVRNVAVSHDETVVAYGCASACGCASVHGHAFAYGRVVAYYGQCVLAAEFEVLRDGSDYGTGKYGAVTAYACTFKNGDVAADARAFADFHIGVDGDERVYHHARCNLGGRMHVC